MQKSIILRTFAAFFKHFEKTNYKMIFKKVLITNLKKILYCGVLLLVSMSLSAQQGPSAQQPSEKEQAMLHRLYETQASGSDSDFYEAHQAFMDYLEGRQDWDKFYRTWMNRIIYDVNHKYFHRSFEEIHLLTDHIKDHHQEQYSYIPNMGLGFFYNGRNQPEVGEKYFRRALRSIDVDKDPVSVFNIYLSLAQSLSFLRPADAMACLDSLPQQMLQNPMYESGVLGYRCIIANKMDDGQAFDRYFARYDTIRQHQPDIPKTKSKRRRNHPTALV